MSNSELYSIRWLGVNSNPKYNRIWGWLVMKDGRNFAFWGVIGKRVDFKMHRWVGALETLVNSQTKKGFTHLNPEDYAKKFDPDFLDNLEVAFMAATLGETFR